MGAMPMFVALDAGGTNTRCCVADDTRVLGRSTGGTVKLMNVGEETATQELQRLVREALEQARVRGSEVKRTCMGLAGISSEKVRDWAKSTLKATVGGGLLLCGDEEIALDAAFQGGPGILIIAGTGSHVIGRCSDGTLVNAGGWGPMIGDEGSGTWIGLEAIRSALKAKDRGQESTLLKAIQYHWGLKSLGELVAKANHNKRPDFAELVPIVVVCAEDGDALAASLLRRAGEELAAQVEIVASKMTAVECTPGDADKVAFTGSVLARVDAVRSAMSQRLRRALPEVRIATKPVEPLEGALWRARHGAVC